MTIQQQTLNPTAGPISVGDDDPLTYKSCMIGAMTFQNRKVREYVENHLEGTVLNACAGETELSHTEVIYRNDIEGERPNLDTNVDVYDLLDVYEESSIDTILYDPPWTISRAKDIYKTDFPGYTNELMRIFDKLLTDNGKIITLGYTTNLELLEDDDLPYQRKAVSIINTFGRMYDFYITVNERVPGGQSAMPTVLKQDVVMNAGTAQPSRETQEEPFSTTYHYGESEADVYDEMREFIDYYAGGNTLDLYSQQPTTTKVEKTLRNEPPSYDAEVDTPPHFAFEPDSVDTKLSHWGFDTVIFNPNDNSVFRNMNEDNTTGLDRALKEALNQRLREHSMVIQVGPTSTLMPNKDAVDNGFSYTRIAVGVFSYPGSDQDIVITVDQVDETNIACEGSNRWERHTTPPSGPSKLECIHCGKEWYLAEYPPLADADCANCGAYSGSYCTTPDGKLPVNAKTPREGLCMTRENDARVECPNHEYGCVAMSLTQWQPLIP